MSSEAQLKLGFFLPRAFASDFIYAHRNSPHTVITTPNSLSQPNCFAHQISAFWFLQLARSGLATR